MFRESYRYKITGLYLYNGKTIKIDTENIKSLFIDYNYKDLNMPVMVLKLSLDKNIIDDMIENIGFKTITLRVCKYEENSKIKIYKDYIQEQFHFLIKDSKNNQKDLDYGKTNVEKQNNLPVHREVTVGLIKQSLIIRNKGFYNNIFKKTSLVNIIGFYSEGVKLLMEPLDNNPIKPFTIIPPIDSYTKLIEYLNITYGLYRNGQYRLFYDFDKTYLLSTSGKDVPSKFEYITTVILEMHDTLIDRSKLKGMITDIDSKSYKIDIDSKDCKTLINTVSQYASKSTMYINGLGEYGAIPNGSININRTNGDRKPTKMTEEDYIINVMKDSLDTSVLTINKQYFISHYDKSNKNLTSRFLLYRKRDIFTRQNDDYQLLNILTFKRVP